MSFFCSISKDLNAHAPLSFSYRCLLLKKVFSWVLVGLCR